MPELKTYKQRVAKVLEKYWGTRNDDRDLYAHYIYTFHPHYIQKDADGEPYIRLKDFRKLPSMESVRRARQIIQNDDGKFLPTSEEVRKERGMKEKDYFNAEVRHAKNFDVYKN